MFLNFLAVEKEEDVVITDDENDEEEVCWSDNIWMNIWMMHPV